MRKYDAVLFDFDGTIADTNELIINSWQHLYMARWGHPEEVSKIVSSFGEPLVVTLGKVLPEWDIDESIQIYRDYQKDIFRDSIQIFPGMGELIRTIKEMGYKVGIVTSRVRRTTLVGLEKFGIDDCIDAIVSCDDTDAHKPNPEPALICLEKLNIPPNRAIMVGDSDYDTGCAHNAGIEAVMVGWAITGDKAHHEGIFRPDYHIQKPEHLLELL